MPIPSESKVVNTILNKRELSKMLKVMKSGETQYSFVKKAILSYISDREMDVE